MQRYRIPRNTDVLQVPFGPTWTWDTILEHYPNLEKEFDGSCIENSFLFYYDKNPTMGVYVPKDEDAENDLAEIFGLDLNCVSMGETNDEETARNAEFERLNSLKEFMLDDPVSIEDRDTLSSMGVSVDEYRLMTNNDSASTDRDTTTPRTPKEQKLSSKSAKKERRQQRLSSR
jgi:hypothetical protein